MKFFLLILLFPIIISAQTLNDFEKDFQKALNTEFSQSDLYSIFNMYGSLPIGLNLSKPELYPLINFRAGNLYKDNIQNLINSKNSNHRILAYLVIASSGDLSFENILLERIKSEKEEGNLMWAGLTLMYLRSNHTTALFDFLVKNEDFGDAHMMPYFVLLNKDSLQATAYSRINSDDLTSKVLAAQLLSVTKLNPKTESLLRDAVKTWDFDIKGYAIYSIKELQIGNILELMKPLLDSNKTREIAFQALANSPTKEDQQFLWTLAESTDSLSEELFDCFFKSKEIENIKLWLRLLYTKKIPQNIYFSIHDQPLLFSDELLIDLQNALDKTTNSDVISNLISALKGRSDDKSIQIIVSFLRDSDESVRYWAAEALRGNKSEKTNNIISNILKDPKIRTTSMVDLAIENEIDSLQTIFEDILSEDSTSLYWERSSIEYLSRFPKERNKDILKKMLSTSDDPFVKSDAAIGLGRLKDEESVNLIIQVLRENSDYEVNPYLTALGMIRGEKAKAEIIKYKNSKDKKVRELVVDILNNW